MDFSNCILDQCELPPVGMVFAINMNAKWLRAIRVDAEVMIIIMHMIQYWQLFIDFF